MENCKDIIVQALYYEARVIIPIYNGKLFINFPEKGHKVMFLERLDKLGISYQISHNDDVFNDLTISVV